MEIPKEELEKITEYAQHGVASVNFTISKLMDRVYRVQEEHSKLLNDIRVELASSIVDIKSIHERLDKLNGQVPKQGEKISQIESDLISTTSFVRGMAKAGAVCATIILSLVVFIFMTDHNAIKNAEERIANHIIQQK